MLWGFAYCSVAKSYQSVPYLLLVFFVEKMIYTITWARWLIENGSTLPALFSESALTATFFSIYGPGTFLWPVLPLGGDQGPPGKAHPPDETGPGPIGLGPRIERADLRRTCPARPAYRPPAASTCRRARRETSLRPPRRPDICSRRPAPGRRAMSRGDGDGDQGACDRPGRDPRHRREHAQQPRAAGDQGHRAQPLPGLSPRRRLRPPAHPLRRAGVRGPAPPRFRGALREVQSQQPAGAQAAGAGDPPPGGCRGAGRRRARPRRRGRRAALRQRRGLLDRALPGGPGRPAAAGRHPGGVRVRPAGGEGVRRRLAHPAHLDHPPPGGAAQGRDAHRGGRRRLPGGGDGAAPGSHRAGRGRPGAGAGDGLRPHRLPRRPRAARRSG